MRSGLVKERTAQANRLRGLLGEYGIVIGKGLAQLRKRLPEILGDAENDLSDLVRALFADLHGRILGLDQHVAAYGDKLETLNQMSAVCRKIGQVPRGSGRLTGDGDGGLARRWSGLRDRAAGLGLARSGARPGFERRQAEAFGDSTNAATPICAPWLIHGARAVVKAAAKKGDAHSRWINALVQRRNANIAAVALANKNARVIWALLRRDEDYRAPVCANARARQDDPIRSACL